MTSHTPVILLTGASRGLGAAAALEAARQGAHLVLNARQAARLESVAEACRAEGATVHTVVGDIGEEATARRMVETAAEAFGRLDAVIHNAGVLPPIAPIAKADLAAWEANWRVNFLAAVALLRHGIPLLRESHGRAVLVSSGAAIHAYPTWGAYCSAKAALNHFTAVLAAEEPDITALAFRPGIVDTDMQADIRTQGQGVMPPDLHAKFLAYQREGRLQPPEVVARPLIAVALHAPHAWSGRFVAYYDADVQQLMQET